MWSCRGTLWLLTSAPHLRFAFGEASAAVTLVGLLKCLEVLPPPILLPLPSWSSSPCSVTATPTPPLPTSPAGTLLPPFPRSTFGRYIKTHLGYARPPGHHSCRFGIPSGDPSSESPLPIFPSCHQAPLSPPASLRSAGPYSHFLAQADTRHLSDVNFLC